MLSFVSQMPRLLNFPNGLIIHSWTLQASINFLRGKGRLTSLPNMSMLSIRSTSAHDVPAIPAEDGALEVLGLFCFLENTVSTWWGEYSFHLMTKRRNEKIQPRAQVEGIWFAFGLSELTFCPSPLFLFLFFPIPHRPPNFGYLNTDTSDSPSLREIPIISQLYVRK